MKQEVRLTLPEFKKGQDKLSKNLWWDLWKRRKNSKKILKN